MSVWSAERPGSAARANRKVRATPAPISLRYAFAASAADGFASASSMVRFGM